MNVHTAQRRRMPTRGCADFGGGWFLCQDAEGVFYLNLDGSPTGKWTESPPVMASAEDGGFGAMPPVTAGMGAP